MEIETINQGLLDQPTRSLFYPTTPMNSPAPNIPGAVSAMSTFTEYMNELELEATLEDDIRAGDKTLDAIFAEDHALGIGGGAALAGRTPAMPQEGGDLAMARAMAGEDTTALLRYAAAANALRCRAALQQHAADLRRHHCIPPLRCSRIALPSCAAAALRGHHCAPPLRCSCQCLALPPLCCSALHCRRCTAR